MRSDRSVWKRLGIKLRDIFAREIVRGIVIGIAVVLIGEPLLNFIRRDPTLSQIARLIEREATLARESSRIAGAADEYASLFADDALIGDVSTPQVWKGHARIKQRFMELPPFDSLQHQLFGDLELQPDGRWANASTRTTFTLRDTGELRVGREEWAFIKDGNEWKIKGFYFNFPTTSP